MSIADDEAIGRSALRKASRRLLLLLGLGYGIAYMDRVNISFAALQMNRTLHFGAAVYGLGAGLFFLSYAACEIPSNLLLVRFGARRWLARIMLTWGLLSIAMLFVRTPHQFYAARLALGAAEAGFFPGVIFYLSQWFPAARRSQAVSRFYLAWPLSSVLMGAIAGSLLKLQGRLGLDGWQWLFLLEGLPAVLMSLVFFLYLPDSPTTAAWLSADERIWILDRLHRDELAAGIPHGGSAILCALREPRVWLMGGFFFCGLMGAYGYAFSAPLLIQQITGLSPTRVGLIIALMGLLSAASMAINGWHSDKTQERFLHILLPMLLVTACFVVAGLSHRAAVTIPAFAIMLMAFTALQGPIWTLPAAFLSGRFAAAGIAAINMMAICGGFAGPWWMGLTAGRTGNYQRGLLTLAIPSLLACLLVSLIRRYTQQQFKAKLAASV